MSAETFCKVACPHCRNNFEFPPSNVGETAPCPHCHTEVILTAPPKQPAAGANAANQVMPFTAVAIYVIGAIQLAISIIWFIVSVGDEKSGTSPTPVAVIVGSVLLLGFASLIKYVHEAARRTARVELLLEQIAKREQ